MFIETADCQGKCMNFVGSFAIENPFLFNKSTLLPHFASTTTLHVKEFSIMQSFNDGNIVHAEFLWVHIHSTLCCSFFYCMVLF